jgi:hypothetical protein
MFNPRVAIWIACGVVAPGASAAIDAHVGDAGEALLAPASMHEAATVPAEALVSAGLGDGLGLAADEAFADASDGSVDGPHSVRLLGSDVVGDGFDDADSLAAVLAAAGESMRERGAQRVAIDGHEFRSEIFIGRLPGVDMAAEDDDAAGDEQRTPFAAMIPAPGSAVLVGLAWMLVGTRRRDVRVA